MNDQPHFLRNVLLKALALFVVLNLVFTALYPLPQLGRLSLYNRLFPGRERLPYADNPEKAYSLSLFNLEAMLASHAVAAPKAQDEFRVILIGDSSAWGWLLPVKDTLAAQLNAMQMSAPDGRRMRFYNLGYPVMSLTKDLLILSYAMHYQPDLILWPVTLESLPKDKQLFPPLLQNNRPAVQKLIDEQQLELSFPEPAESGWRAFWKRTIIGARRELADLLRLQLYGAMWAATGIDQDIPAEYTPLQTDQEADLGFHDLQPPTLNENDLAFDVLEAGLHLAGSVPVLIINEPIYISQGQNSDLRYNFFYPRWAYDAYRPLLEQRAAENGAAYLDAWDLVPAGEFTNSAVHLSPAGSRLLADAVEQALQEMFAQPGVKP